MPLDSTSDPAAPSQNLFDPNKAFLDLKIVRVTIEVILSIMTLSSLAIIFHDHLSFDFTSQGFNTAASIFKVPLGALTFAIPALALLAANHRSEQTKRQMSLTLTQIERTDRQIQIAQGQNAFSNYYKHLEEFEKRFKTQAGQAGFSVHSPHKVHSLLFPWAAKGDLNLEPSLLTEFDGNATSFIEACEHLSHSGSWAETAHYMFSNMEKLSTRYKLSFPNLGGVQVAAQSGNFTVYGGSVLTAIQHYIEMFRYIDEMFSFDPSYNSSVLLRTLLNAKIDRLGSTNFGSSVFIPFDFRKALQD